MGVIGDTLSEARTRRAVDLEEVHAATGIRPRYLEAIEQEDWDGAPGGVLRALPSSASTRSLPAASNPDPLVEEYQAPAGTAGARRDAPTSPFARTRSRKAAALRRRRKRQSVYAWIGAIGLLAAIVVAIVLISSSGGEDGGAKPAKGTAGDATGKAGANGGGKAGATGGGGKKNGAKAGGGTGASAQTVKLKIEPTAEVWACVVNAKGKRLVEARADAGHRRIGRAVQVTLLHRRLRQRLGPRPGRRQSAEDTGNVEPDGGLRRLRGKVHELPEGKRPTCE